MARVFIGIGSNVGDRHAHLALTRRALGALPDTRVVGFSEAYETEPVGPVEQGKFLNAAAEIETSLSPQQLLTQLHAIEQQAGRPPEQHRVKWGPRPLDLDILWYDGQVIRTGSLEVPHPRMHERWFVLKPLADLDPNLLHPQLGKTVGQLLEAVEAQQYRAGFWNNDEGDKEDEDKDMRRN